MDNFDLKKYLVENKVTTNSRMMNENEEDFSVELLVPKIYFNVETGELAETPAAFGADSELEDMDITNYSDGEELIGWVFDGSLEKAKHFEEKYPGLFKVVDGSTPSDGMHKVILTYIKPEFQKTYTKDYDKYFTFLKNKAKPMTGSNNPQFWVKFLKDLIKNEVVTMDALNAFAEKYNDGREGIEGLAGYLYKQGSPKFLEMIDNL